MKEQEGFFSSGSVVTTTAGMRVWLSGSFNSISANTLTGNGITFAPFVHALPIKLKYKKLFSQAKAPVKAHSGDLAYDLFALENITIFPSTVTKISTGIACGFPAGYGAVLRDRSSVATKQEVFVVAGVIDNGYIGEIIVAMFNPHDEYVYFKQGDKIAQMILTPVVTFETEEVESLEDTDRGAGGFGSTGV